MAEFFIAFPVAEKEQDWLSRQLTEANGPSLEWLEALEQAVGYPSGWDRPARVEWHFNDGNEVVISSDSHQAEPELVAAVIQLFYRQFRAPDSPPVVFATSWTASHEGCGGELWAVNYQRCCSVSTSDEEVQELLLQKLEPPTTSQDATTPPEKEKIS